MDSFASAQAAFSQATPFVPPLATDLLPTLALVLLLGAFLLAFYTSTLPKSGLPVQEIGLAGAASILLGFGTVFAFCAVGVPV